MIPLKIKKLQSQQSMLDHHRHASIAGRPMMANLKWYLYPLFPQLVKTKKNPAKLDPL